MAPVKGLGAVRYRVWQMWRSLAVRSLSDDDRAILSATLPSRGQALFATLSLNDQPARYYLVAVISDADRTTVILCDCRWKSRQIWRLVTPGFPDPQRRATSTSPTCIR